VERKNMIGHWRKGHDVIKCKEPGELCSSVLWKVEFVNDKCEYLAQMSLKQMVRHMARFLLAVYNKRRDK
jgi:hypothetical protein